MQTTTPETADSISLAAEIVSAFVAHNSLPSAELPALIQSVHASLTRLASGAATPAVAEPVAPTPATTIRKSITPDYLICLDDGRKFKSLRRHLAALGMTPEQYRTKWSLAADYPMVAPNYSATRSALAKQLGLGQVRKNTTAAPAKVEVPAKRKAGRPRKAALAASA